jgi:hypothetical protein
MSGNLAFIRPLVPSPVARPPKGGDWLHEPKWDGFRFQVIKDSSLSVRHRSFGHDTVCEQTIASARNAPRQSETTSQFRHRWIEYRPIGFPAQSSRPRRRVSRCRNTSSTLNVVK